MKIEAIAASKGAEKAQGHAHGLVRQLQDGTFRGASVEKHRARFAEQLAPKQTPVAPADADVSVDELTATAVPETTRDGLAPRLGQYVDYLV